MSKKKIILKKSPTAGIEGQVSKKQLYKATKMHVADVKRAMIYIANKVVEAAQKHDYTKLQDIDDFYKDFKNNFETND